MSGATFQLWGGEGMGANCAVNVIWDPSFLKYDFGAAHPFTEKSRWMAVRLLEEEGFFQPRQEATSMRVSAVPTARREELLRFHSPEYLNLVDRLGRSRSAPPLDAGDTPSFLGCYEAAAALTGGTLAAARDARSHPARHSFSPAGGLHHAHPDRASGFCIFNDIAVAIRGMQEESPTLRRIAYVDIDVHHGDGVMYGFYEDGGVLDIDFHQDGRTIFPGTGFPSETGRGDGAGLKVNVPLPPETGDEAFVPLFEQIVPTMVRRYRPELILMQCGMDAHVGDRLGSLQYTFTAYERAVDLVHSLAHEVCEGRFVVAGGGGYTAENVSRGLARVGIRVAHRSRSDETRGSLPESWRNEFEQTFSRPAPRTWNEEWAPEGSLWTPDRTDKLLETLSERLGVRWDRSDLTPDGPARGRE
jgi:acetoin utilization protein AcuC